MVSNSSEGLEDTLTFLSFLSLDAGKVSTNNILERMNREVLRRTGVGGIFPNSDLSLRPVAAYLMEHSEDRSVTGSYWSEESLQALYNQAA